MLQPALVSEQGDNGVIYQQGSPDTALAKPILGAEPGWLPFCVSGKDDDIAAEGPRKEGARLGFCPSDICPSDGNASARPAPVRQADPKSGSLSPLSIICSKASISALGWSPR